MRNFKILRNSTGHQDDLSIVKGSKSDRLSSAAETALLTGRPIDLGEIFVDLPSVDGYTASPISRENFTENLPIDQAARSYSAIGPEIQWEYILKTLHLCLLRGWNTRLIARLFNVSINTITNWKAKLKEKFRKDAENFEFGPFVGETMAFFDVVVQDAMAIAHDNHASPRERLKALDTALDAKRDLVRFFSVCGVFDGNRVTGKKDVNETVQQIDILRKMTRDMADAFKHNKIDTINENRLKTIVNQTRRIIGRDVQKAS